MPVTIDEVTAEVDSAQPDHSPESGRPANSPSPSEVRRQREQLERIKMRTARVFAD